MGSWLGLERPYISSLEESAVEGKDEFCLEYGSATHLYLVPSNLQEERVDELFCCSYYFWDRSALIFDVTNLE